MIQVFDGQVCPLSPVSGESYFSILPFPSVRHSRIWVSLGLFGFRAFQVRFHVHPISPSRHRFRVVIVGVGVESNEGTRVNRGPRLPPPMTVSRVQHPSFSSRKIQPQSQTRRSRFDRWGMGVTRFHKNLSQSRPSFPRVRSQQDHPKESFSIVVASETRKPIPIPEG